MGMFDTVHFPQPVNCGACGAQIATTQTKAFACLLDDFHVGDCVANAEETRTVQAGLYCDECHALDKQFVHLVVYRGILIDVAPDLSAAEALLQSFSLERLTLMYHELYAKRMAAQGRLHSVARFLHDLADWYVEGYAQMTAEELRPHRFLTWHRHILEQSDSPLAAIRAYLAAREEEQA